MADSKFVHPVPEHLRCARCRRALNEAVQSSCGERWHAECLKEAVKLSDESRCPICGEKLDPKLCWRDVFADKELAQLVVYCQCKSKGCTWTGQLQSLKVHLESCQFSEVRCLNAKCQEKLTRYQIEEHTAYQCAYRLVECPYCDSQVTVFDQEAHRDECRKLRVECPNECEDGFIVPREDLPDHLTQCPNRKAVCPVAGCETKVRETELEEHLATAVEHHVGLVNENCLALQQSLSQNQSSIDQHLDEIQQGLQSNQRGIETVTQRLAECECQLTEAVAQQKIMQQKTLEVCYQSVDNLQKEQRSVFDRVEQSVRIMTEKMIKMEETVSLQAVRIQQLEERRIENRPANGMSDRVREMFTTQDRVAANHDIKLAEHSLRLDMMDCKNTEGVLLWKITEIRRRRREAVSGKTPSIYSQPFYSSQCGYKMCARMYLNGDGMGRGTHLSLFFVVIRGEYDALLPWPFSQKVTLVLIDQVTQRHISDTFRPDPQSSSFARPRSEMNVASGCPLFVSLATLDGGGYIKDDAMFIKIIIDPTNVYKPDAR